MRREQAAFLRYGIGTVSLVLALLMGATVASGQVGASQKHISVVTVTFLDKGSTVHLYVGQKLKVVLGSTYWSIKPSSNPRSLAQIGVVKVLPRAGCVTGAGCGTVTALFRAVAPGSAAVTASRGSCGEALGCTKGSGNFNVAVRVT
jgi:hypothetical protein